MIVESFMTRQVVTVTPETPILDAARLMLQHKIGGLPVVSEGGRIAGIITESDLLRGGKSDVRTKPPHWLRLMVERGSLTDESTRLAERKVSDVMTPDPVTIAETAPIEEAAHLIAEHDIKRLPVVHDNKLVGIIARADIVRGIIKAARRLTDATMRSEMTDEHLLELQRQSLLRRARMPT